jgi:hypothetical protein
MKMCDSELVGLFALIQIYILTAHIHIQYPLSSNQHPPSCARANDLGQQMTKVPAMRTRSGTGGGC